MSVMVMGKEYYERIGKYLSLRMSEERSQELCLKWHELNLRNYVERYKHHGEKFEGLEFEELNFSRVGIPSAVQVHSDLRAVYYNCIDYGEEIDPEALSKLEEYIKLVENSEEYHITKRYEEQVAF